MNSIVQADDIDAIRVPTQGFKNERANLLQLLDFGRDFMHFIDFQPKTSEFLQF
jgi:hypothetical protein